MSTIGKVGADGLQWPFAKANEHVEVVAHFRGEGFRLPRLIQAVGNRGVHLALEQLRGTMCNLTVLFQYGPEGRILTFQTAEWRWRNVPLLECNSKGHISCSSSLSSESQLAGL